MATSTAGFLPTDVSQIAAYNLKVDSVYKLSFRYPWNGGDENSDSSFPSITLMNLNGYYKVVGIASYSEASSSKIDLYKTLYKPLTVEDNEATTNVDEYNDRRDEFQADLLIIKLFPLYLVKNTDTDEELYIPTAFLNSAPNGLVNQYSALTIGFDLGLQPVDNTTIVQTIAKDIREKLIDSSDLINLDLASIQPLVFTYATKYRTQADYESAQRINPASSGIAALFSENRALRNQVADLQSQLAAYKAHVEQQNS